MGMIADLFVKLGLKKEGFDAGIDQAKKKTQGFSNEIKKIGGLLAGAFSVGAIWNFAKNAITAYDEEAKAHEQLLVALKGRKDIQQDLINQASRLQKTTLFGDEVTVQAQAILAGFIKDEQQIKKLIPLIQDFATAYKMDLASAAKLVARSVATSTNALARQGIEIEGAAGSVERLNSAYIKLNERVGGQAAAAAQVGTGALTQLQNAWSDLFETVGKGITKSKTFEETIASLKQTIEEITAGTFQERGLLGFLGFDAFKKDKKQFESDLDGIKTKVEEEINKTIIKPKFNTDSIEETFTESEQLANQIKYLKEQIKIANDELSKTPAGESWQSQKDKVNSLTEALKKLIVIKRDKNLTEMSGAIGTAFGTVKAPKTEITPLTAEGLFSTESGDMWTDAMSDTLIGLDTWYAGLESKIKELKADLPDLIGEFNNELTNLIKFGSMDALQQLTEGLTLLAAGAITGKDFGNQVLKMVGNFMVQLGTLFIISSKAYQAFQTSLVSGNFAGMLAAGVALVVAGAAISALAGKGVTGGSGAGGAGAAASGYNPSGSTAAQTLTGNVFFELEGVKLKGVLNNVDRRNNVMR